MDVAEQAPLVSRGECRPAAELARPADVVHEGRGEHELAAEPGVKLGRLTAEGGDADRVLEQPACIGMVGVGRRRIRREVAFGEDRAYRGRESLVRQLVDEELEEALQLVDVAPRGRR